MRTCGGEEELSSVISVDLGICRKAFSSKTKSRVVTICFLVVSQNLYALLSSEYPQISPYDSWHQVSF